MKVPDEIKRRDPISLLPRKLNEVIHYLRAARLVAGPGVRLRESTSGTMMTVETKPSGGSVVSGGAPAGYSGYFKVIDASERDESGEIIASKVKIVNGASPDDADCGDTDLGTVAAQEVAYTLPAASARHHVYLRAKYATGTYSFDFIVGDDSAKPVTPYGYFVLADVDSKGSVTQVWQGGFIYWASRYYT